MIQVQSLTKRYGSKYALNDVSFSVGEGEIVGFLGPNGAGKTTTMNILTGYLSATAGSASVGGYDILTQPKKAKALIGYLPEQPPLYLEMTVREYLGFLYRLKGVKGNLREDIFALCERLGLDEVFYRKIGNLSKGYRQRVGLAQALLGNPPVLVLDEPTVGLDPRQIIDIRTLIKDLGKERTVILSSHILTEIQAMCPRVIVIGEGRLLADGSPDDLAGNLGAANQLLVRIDGPREPVQKLLEGIPGIALAEMIGPREGALDWALSMEEGADIRRPLFFALAKKGWPVLSMKSGEATLEEVFLELTARAEAALEELPEEDWEEEGEEEGSSSEANWEEGGDH